MAPSEPTAGPRGSLDPVLERVYRRGYRLRVRGRIARAASIMVAVVVLTATPVLGIMAARSRNGAERPPVLLTPPSPGPCHDSFDPECGAFRWIVTPEPDRPATVSIAFAPEHPAVGEQVTFTVTVSDPDAPSLGSYRGSMWGDVSDAVVGTALRCEPPYGPWSPPDRRSRTKEFTYAHRFSKAGTFRIAFAGTSSSGSPWDRGCGADPYGAETTAWTVVEVR